MSALTHTTVSVGASVPKELPADLRTWLPPDRLLMLTVEAVGGVTKQTEKGGAVQDGTCTDVVDWASRKIQTAILMDASAAD